MPETDPPPNTQAFEKTVDFFDVPDSIVGSVKKWALEEKKRSFDQGRAYEKREHEAAVQATVNTEIESLQAQVESLRDCQWGDYRAVILILYSALERVMYEMRCTCGDPGCVFSSCPYCDCVEAIRKARRERLDVYL